MAHIKKATPPQTREAIAQAKAAFTATSAGEVTAVVATLNVIDSDGDYTVAGAFPEGEPVPVSAYGHTSWSGALPVGTGVITVSGDLVLANMKFILSTQSGRETFEVVRELGPLGQWSYGYDVLDSTFGEMDGEPVRILRRLKIHEVSPVLVGAGVGVVTLDAKTRAELEAIRADLLTDEDQAAAREYARFARHLIGSRR
jgi:hypothetical protein